jgi:hypothetical protein
MNISKLFLLSAATFLSSALSPLAFAADFSLTINNKTNENFMLSSTAGAKPQGELRPFESNKVLKLDFMYSAQKFALLFYSTTTGNKGSVIYENFDNNPQIFCNPQTPTYHCEFNQLTNHSATLNISKLG